MIERISSSTAIPTRSLKRKRSSVKTPAASILDLGDDTLSHIAGSLDGTDLATLGAAHPRLHEFVHGRPEIALTLRPFALTHCIVGPPPNHSHARHLLEHLSNSLPPRLRRAVAAYSAPKSGTSNDETAKIEAQRRLLELAVNHAKELQRIEPHVRSWHPDTQNAFVDALCALPHTDDACNAFRYLGEIADTLPERAKINLADYVCGAADPDVRAELLGFVAATLHTYPAAAQERVVAAFEALPYGEEKLTALGQFGFIAHALPPHLQQRLSAHYPALSPLSTRFVVKYGIDFSFSAHAFAPTLQENIWKAIGCMSPGEARAVTISDFCNHATHFPVERQLQIAELLDKLPDSEIGTVLSHFGDHRYIEYFNYEKYALGLSVPQFPIEAQRKIVERVLRMTDRPQQALAFQTLLHNGPKLEPEFFDSLLTAACRLPVRMSEGNVPLLSIALQHAGAFAEELTAQQKDLLMNAVRKLTLGGTNTSNDAPHGPSILPHNAFNPVLAKMSAAIPTYRYEHIRETLTVMGIDRPDRDPETFAPFILNSGKMSPTVYARVLGYLEAKMPRS